jgi:hypothetical protein
MPQLRNLPHLRSEEPRHIGFPNRPHVSSKSPRHLQPQRTFHASASKTSAPTTPCGITTTSAPKLSTSSSEEPSTPQLQKASALRAPKKGTFSTSNSMNLRHREPYDPSHRHFRNVPLFEPLRRETIRAFRLETFGTRNQPSAPPARRASAYSSSKELSASSPTTQNKASQLNNLRSLRFQASDLRAQDRLHQGLVPSTPSPEGNDTSSSNPRHRQPKTLGPPPRISDTSGQRDRQCFSFRSSTLRSPNRRPLRFSTPPARKPSVPRIVDASKPGSLRISGQSLQHLEPPKARHLSALDAFDPRASPSSAPRTFHAANPKTFDASGSQNLERRPPNTVHLSSAREGSDTAHRRSSRSPISNLQHLQSEEIQRLGPETIDLSNLWSLVS